MIHNDERLEHVVCEHWAGFSRQLFDFGAQNYANKTTILELCENEVLFT